MAKLGMLKNVQPDTGTQDSRSVTLTVKDIPIGDIRIKENVRVEYTEIDELAESIRRYGLLQPITVYMEENGCTVKTGHRRFLAYQKLYQTEPERFHSIRCIISDAQNIVLVQLIENVQRVDLSQIDLLNTLNGLKAQGMTLKRIAEVMGKTEGYIKNLFVGVNEINKDNDLHNMISHAGVTISDIAETKSVSNEKERMKLLDERRTGKINRAKMREKVQELATPVSEKKAPVKTEQKAKKNKINISIKVFPELKKIIIYLANTGNKEQLASIEEDLQRYFTANKERYLLVKTKKEGVTENAKH